VIVCNNDHRFLVKDAVERLGISPGAIILEPVARNTAAAVAVGALAALADDEDAVLVVAPSDHLMREEAGFAEHVRDAIALAAEGRLVLFGVTPAEPHTGYGYIQGGERLNGGAARKVAAFTEKPDRVTATRYIESGDYFWNSGIFVLHARTFVDELAIHEPAVLAAARQAYAKAKEDLGFLRLDGAAFAGAPSISVDHAVMERTDKAVMLPMDFGWSDAGSWASLWDAAGHDENGNHITGEGSLHGTSGCYVHSEKALVATIG
jgi:mannose-1-phosphate guanylyltransferase/mannose-6-phosphate isomerase